VALGKLELGLDLVLEVEEEELGRNFDPGEEDDG